MGTTGGIHSLNTLERPQPRSDAMFAAASVSPTSSDTCDTRSEVFINKLAPRAKRACRWSTRIDCMAVNRMRFRACGTIESIRRLNTCRVLLSPMDSICMTSGGCEFIDIAIKFGYEFRRQSGSHVILKKDSNRLTIPLHQTLKTGTLLQIMREMGITREQLFEQL